MRLSENIKRFRLENKLTQDQLAAKLGISAQAVSKWETSETYPDGTLLVPLANALGVLLDELFGNDTVSMPDVSRRIISLIRHAEQDDRFALARDICWQIERGLFGCRMEIDTKYDPDELKRQHNDSYILEDGGFTVVANGQEPFFAVFQQPEGGFGDFLKDREELQKIFSALSHTDTVNALVRLYQKNENYIFESAVLARDCGICDEQIGGVMEELSLLGVVEIKELNIDGRKRVLFCSHPCHIPIALFLMAHRIGYKGAYSLKSHNRQTPLISAPE